MVEHGSYLESILGEGALRIETERKGDLILGRFDVKKSVLPLSGINQSGGDALFVTDQHASGHFLGPQTLPGYRMLEILGVGSRITEASKVRFDAIVKPGDAIVAVKKGSSMHIKRGVQEVASAEISFGEQGLEARHFGMVLEIASQTLVENMARRKRIGSVAFYPLLLSVDRIEVLRGHFNGLLRIDPTQLSDLLRDRFTASAQIINDKGELVASVENAGFMFATEKEIEFFYRFKRKSN